MESKEQIERLSDFRQSIQSLSISTSVGQTIYGFCDPLATQPVLQILRESVLNGQAESKEYAANGLTELLTLTDAKALGPHVVNVTGPLIRILGDRYPPTVKAAILGALALLLEKVI